MKKAATPKKRSKKAAQGEEILPSLPDAPYYLQPFHGHAAICSDLTQMAARFALPHAFLFHGPQGIGKRLLASKLACLLLCGEEKKSPSGSLLAEETPTESSLNFDATHENFHQIVAGSCADYMVLSPLEGKKIIAVKQIRAALQQLCLAAEGRRVLIIDAAENMNASAANALLKTLEEPSEHVHLILISHNPSKLLPTVISRCRQLRFSLLSETEAHRVLKAHSSGKKALEFLPLTPGAPGMAIRMAAEGKEALKAVDDFLEQIHTANLWPMDVAEKLHRSKLVPTALDILLARVAQKARASAQNSIAELYETLDKKRRDMLEYNLPAPTTLCACLEETQGVYRKL